MPFSISTVRPVGVPSSSTLSEPRRLAMVPSSTTVQSSDATRLPMRSENADVPLRLKSPSRPWPIASCSRMPGQPGPSTTVIVPGGRVDGVEVDDAPGAPPRARSARRGRRASSREREAAAAAVRALLAHAVALGDAGDAQARRSGRTSPTSRPSGVADQHDACSMPMPGHARCVMRGSSARAPRSRRSSSATWSASGVSSGGARRG